MDSELRESRMKLFTCPYPVKLTLGLAGHPISVYILAGTVVQQEVEGDGRYILHPEMLNCILKSTIILDNTRRTSGAVDAHDCGLS